MKQRSKLMTTTIKADQQKLVKPRSPRVLHCIVLAIPGREIIKLKSKLNVQNIGETNKALKINDIVIFMLKS